jgi:spore coat polysaccharide biosynthesis protein SpsF
MTRSVALIQARMSSTRFPGKVLEPIAGVPSIVYMVNRARRAKRLDNVVVVTSVDLSDDPLTHALTAADIPVFRGDLNDVLKRYADAAREYMVTEVVRLTGDCPLIDPVVIDAVVDARRATEADYASNIEPPSFPDGLDCECFTREALDRTLDAAKLVAEREHVTLWMRSDASGFRRVNHRCIVDASHLRLTVDYPDDLAVVKRLVALMPSSQKFDLYDLLRGFAMNPDLLALNSHTRNEGIPAMLDTEGQSVLDHLPLPSSGALP